jgi:hypothetical protein
MVERVSSDSIPSSHSDHVLLRHQARTAKEDFVLRHSRLHPYGVGELLNIQEGTKVTCLLTTRCIDGMAWLAHAHQVG